MKAHGFVRRDIFDVLCSEKFSTHTPGFDKIMAQYSLSKACRECIKAKKRCDRSLPLCRRCASLSKGCSYQNEPLTKRHTSTTPSPPKQKPTGFSPTRKRHPTRLLTLALAPTRLLTPDYACEVDMAAIQYMIDGLRAYSAMALGQNNAPFMHPRLYRRFRRPSTLTLVERMSFGADGRSLYPTTEDRMMNKAVIDLLLACEASSISLIDYLGFVQALVILQIMTAFWPQATAEDVQEAHERQKVLVRCSERLWLSAPSELPSSLSPCDSYILAESVRRTLLVSYAVQAVYCVLRTGFFAHTPFGSALPFDINRKAWEEDCLEGNCIHSNANTNLYSYREYVEHFEAGKTGQLRPFEKMLPVGCHGVDSVEAGHVI